MPDAASPVLALDVSASIPVEDPPPSVAVDVEYAPPSPPMCSGDAAHDASAHGSASAAQPTLLAARARIAIAFDDITFHTIHRTIMNRRLMRRPGGGDWLIRP